VTADRGANERPPERADFEATRLNGPHRRPSLAVVGWLVVLAAFVAIGLTGRSTETRDDRTAAASTAGADADGRATGAPTPGGPRRQDVHLSQRFDPAFPSLVVVEASESGPIRVLTTRRPSMVTVIGAVSLQPAIRILVTLQSLDGQPVGSASEVIPLLASDGRDHLPPLGFNIWLAVPAGLADRVLVVQTSAYDTRGVLLATTLAQLDPEL
jgi:hypothetical protein